MNKVLIGRVALVTGAGRGIGRAIALELSRHCAAMVLAARSVQELEETAQLLGPDVPCIAVRTDVASAQDVEALCRAAIERFGKIDILVNNAGMLGPIGPLVDNDPAMWMRTLEVNTLGPFLCIRQVLPQMMSRRRGKIVNVSGGGATGARPYFSAYAASKAALVRLTETVAEEVRPFNIQVNAIAPGAINTRMLEQVLDAGDAAGKELEAARQQQAEGGASAEIAAKLVAYLASDASGTLSGKLISALHDGWQQWTNDDLEQLSAAPWLMLRRMDKHTISSLGAAKREVCHS